MAATFRATCPCGSGATVDATDAGFSATTVEVAACPACREAGIATRTMRKTAAYALAVPEPGPWQHRDGLVSFG